MWVIRGGPPGQPVVLFEYDKSRSAEVASRLLDGSVLIKQWLATVMLGAINIEQSKLLSWDVLRWFLGDATLADAILDRLLHNSHKLKLKGESMRKIMRKFTESDHSE